MRKGDPNPIHLAPTEMGKCPIQLTDKKENGKKFNYTEKILEIFKKGTRIHHNEGIYRKGGRGTLDIELHMTVIKRSLDMIFSGYADFIMIDEKGLYGEDLKSCARNAFYHFNKEPNSFTEKIQLSAYRWLYYVVFGVDIERWIITKVDRDEPRNRMSLLIETYTPEQMEEFILGHPSILSILGKKLSEEAFLREAKKIIKKARWLCRYCDDKKTCIINKVLTAEELAEKNRKKEGKKTFNKLIEEYIE